MASHNVESQVAGSVWKLQCQVGDTVAEGDTLLIIESMKMEIPIDAPSAGKVQELFVAEGEAVAEGQVLGIVVG